MSAPHPPPQADTLAAKIKVATGVAMARCYQCGKCAAGCPVSRDMDLPPCQVLRMLQYGFPDLDREVLSSEGIWLCMACETCVTRCPQDVDIPKVMDFLRTEAVRLGVAHPRSRDILAFHHAFLDSIRLTGRLFEVGLVADYKARSFHFLKDVALAPRMYLRGKLGLLPHVIKDRGAMRRIFSRTVGAKGVKA